MVPTLHDADLLVVRCAPRVADSIRSGDVVLATFRALPDRFVLKRADHRQDGGWWLVSENQLTVGDSSVHGVADVHGRVVLRLRGWRLRRLRRPHQPG
jgi:hypothetical protein